MVSQQASQTQATQAGDPSRAHPMMPSARHDEAARHAHVVAFKNFLMRQVETRWRQLIDEKVSAQMAEIGRDAAAEYRQLERNLGEVPAYRAWQTLMVAAQDEMWRSVAESVDRDLPQLKRIDAEHGTLGSVRVDPTFKPPRYLTSVDIHRMPGGYHADSGEGDLRQGAIFDKAAALYHMGRNGGAMNDLRGHTIAQHFFDRFGEEFADRPPRRILDMGCTVGHSTVALAQTFSQAEIHGIDVGAALLRYARARSAGLGVAVHYSQQSAEHTDFADDSFDMVVSSAVLHETSARAAPAIMRECWRVLRPGGVMIHLEVPLRFDGSAWNRVRGWFESVHNNEPFWIGAQKTNFAELAVQAGFTEVGAGYQPTVTRADPSAAPRFTTTPGPVHVVWYMISGIKPQA
jgi:SAM-dependent methyltransferase